MDSAKTTHSVFQSRILMKFNLSTCLEGLHHIVGPSESPAARSISHSLLAQLLHRTTILSAYPLPRGVMVTQEILILSFKVRILAG